jgi:hypothetical protein
MLAGLFTGIVQDGMLKKMTGRFHYASCSAGSLEPKMNDALSHRSYCDKGSSDIGNLILLGLTTTSPPQLAKLRPSAQL